jgi:hypothetical protein
VRVVSNLVEDRDTSRWRLADACRRNAEATAMLAEALRG